MKPSGLPWCPEVPEHWELNPNRAYLRQRKVLVGERHRDYTLLSLTKRGVIVRDLTDNKGKFSADMGTSQEVRPGDLVMCLFDIPETPRTIGLSEHNGMITSAYTVFELKSKEAAHWLELFYLAMDDQKALSPLYSGLRNTIQQPRFLGTRTPIPPLNEQNAIVRYLDYVERRTRRLVHSKRKLISLLAEEKQVLIQQAVTRGLDPAIPLKDSGIKWVGKIPEHWKVQRSKQIFSQRKELARPEDIQLSATQAYGVIPQDMYEQKVGRKIVKVFLHLEKRRHVEVDDFVISMRSFQGGLERAWASGCIRSSYVVLRPITKVDIGFFSYLFKSYGYIGALQATADFIRDGQDLNFDNFCAVDLPVPPLEEQRQIADALQKVIGKTSQNMERIEREISLLNEFSKRLISDVVTGKLDARDAAAELPEVDPLAEDANWESINFDLDTDSGEFKEDLDEVEA